MFTTTTVRAPLHCRCKLIILLCHDPRKDSHLMSETQPTDLTILVVEDYEDTSLAMRLALEDRGYRILEASDGAAAVELAGRERPDIILMDLSLPVMDGLEASKQIRSHPEMEET